MATQCQLPVAACQMPRGLTRHTIDQVLADHRIRSDEFFGPCRTKGLVAARRDAARRLHDLGYSCSKISRAIKRAPATVLNYLPETQERKEIRYAGKRIVSRLAPDLAALVSAIAKAEEVSLEDLIVRWVADRAEGEAHHALSREGEQ